MLTRNGARSREEVAKTLFALAHHAWFLVGGRAAVLWRGLGGPFTAGRQEGRGAARGTGGRGVWSGPHLL
jgi:hypothetical protein